MIILREYKSVPSKDLTNHSYIHISPPFLTSPIASNSDNREPKQTFENGTMPASLGTSSIKIYVPVRTGKNMHSHTYAHMPTHWYT